MAGASGSSAGAAGAAGTPVITGAAGVLAGALCIGLGESSLEHAATTSTTPSESVREFETDGVVISGFLLEDVKSRCPSARERGWQRSKLENSNTVVAQHRTISRAFVAFPSLGESSPVLEIFPISHASAAPASSGTPADCVVVWALFRTAEALTRSNRFFHSSGARTAGVPTVALAATGRLPSRAPVRNLPA
jgi:hypothetical protein